MIKFNSLLTAVALTVLAGGGLPARSAITTPALVSAGMTQIMAYVPAQAGATYAWTITHGTLSGVTTNAMVYYNAPASGPVELACTVTVAGVATVTTLSVPVAPVVAHAAS